MDVDWLHRARLPAEDDPESVLTEADNMASVWKLERDAKAWLEALPEDGRAVPEDGTSAPACTAGDGDLDQMVIRTVGRRSA